MRRIIKDSNSEIIKKNLTYKVNGDNTALGKILLEEQHHFCAYTEEYITVNDANDIEHFNPTLKGEPTDNYNNWFKVKHQWNKRKTDNWIEPVLHPTAEDFDSRIIYFSGEYFAKPADTEANNLISLLNLNDRKLVENRKNYIKRRKERIDELKTTAQNYFNEKVKNEVNSIYYLRAIKEEFGIDIIEFIKQNKQQQ